MAITGNKLSPILVTGASGQLGRRLVPCLLKAGYNVRAQYRSAEKAAKYCPAGADVVIGDLREPSWLFSAATRCQAMIHGAAKVSMRRGNFEELNQINIEGTKAVIVACRENGVKRLVNISSIVSVGASNDGNPIDEAAEFNLGNFDIPYIKTKREAEVLALSANCATLEVISVNPSIMISPPDREIKPGDIRKIPKFLPAYFDFGLNVVETEDVINGIISALELGRPGERYLLTGENIDPQKVFAISEKYFGIKKPLLKIPVPLLVPISWITASFDRVRGKRPKFYSDLARLGRLRFFYSHDKASRELGYNPRPLEKTVSDILDKIKTR
jgi:dihydroflavonol-4-reductase